MKLKLLFLALVLTGCSANQPTATNIIDAPIQNAIAYGELQQLNELSPNVDKPLLLRLWRAPTDNHTCFVETEGVCQYQYFLSVASFDEQPETNVFALEPVGEIEQIGWLDSTAEDTAVLEIQMQDYTKMAASNNSALEVKPMQFTLTVTPKSIHYKFAE